ncbi:MAG: tRNA glutamyl-Q(34) synthetase GluQRS [Parvularculaceae bacterium]
MDAFVTRFAPSPTGHLHLGHAFSALTAYRAAGKAGGRFLLRIEDIDQGRCRADFEAAIYEDLHWLGLDWEKPVRRQSEHFGDYAAALDRLKTKGLVYRCFKTRKEILDEIASAPHLSPQGPEGPQYVGAPPAREEEERRIASGEPFAWRVSMERAREALGADFSRLTFREEIFGGARDVKATPQIFGDLIVARKDAGTSYHLASVSDDALQGVTHVIRGEDLFTATHAHRLLQALLGLPAPTYRHHRLITDDAGKKFSKRDQAATLRALRDSGVTRADVLARVGFSD